MIGSAWSEREEKRPSVKDDAVTSYNSGITELSRQQRMNTDVRRKIFCTVMTSEVHLSTYHLQRKLRVSL